MILHVPVYIHVYTSIQCMYMFVGWFQELETALTSFVQKLSQSESKSVSTPIIPTITTATATEDQSQERVSQIPCYIHNKSIEVSYIYNGQLIRRRSIHAIDHTPILIGIHSYQLYKMSETYQCQAYLPDTYSYHSDPQPQ